MAWHGEMLHGMVHGMARCCMAWCMAWRDVAWHGAWHGSTWHGNTYGNTWHGQPQIPCTQLSTGAQALRLHSCRGPPSPEGDKHNHCNPGLQRQRNVHAGGRDVKDGRSVHRWGQAGGCLTANSQCASQQSRVWVTAVRMRRARPFLTRAHECVREERKVTRPALMEAKCGLPNGKHHSGQHGLDRVSACKQQS